MPSTRAQVTSRSSPAVTSHLPRLPPVSGIGDLEGHCGREQGGNAVKQNDENQCGAEAGRLPYGHLVKAVLETVRFACG